MLDKIAKFLDVVLTIVLIAFGIIILLNIIQLFGTYNILHSALFNVFYNLNNWIIRIIAIVFTIGSYYFVCPSFVTILNPIRIFKGDSKVTMKALIKLGVFFCVLFFVFYLGDKDTMYDAKGNIKKGISLDSDRQLDTISQPGRNHPMSGFKEISPPPKEIKINKKTVCFVDGNAVVFYCFRNNEIIFFNDSGKDPLTGKELLPVTSEIIEEYFKNKNNILEPGSNIKDAIEKERQRISEK